MLLDGARLDLVRLLDERHDDVGLAARADLGLDLAERGRALRLREDARRDRRPARRLLVERRDVEVPVERQREGARDRRRGHDEEVRARRRRVRLRRDRRPLRDAEAVLLVDHDEAEAPELDGVLEERVRPDEHVDAAAGERVEDLRAGLALHAAGQELGAETRLAEDPEDRRKVLLGEDLGRRHERRLKAALGGEDRREDGDDRLPAPDVALEEPAHRAARAEVLADLPDHALLRRRQRERKRFLEARADRVVGRQDRRRHGGALPAAALEADLELEELLEDEAVEVRRRALRPLLRVRRAAGAAREVGFSQRVGEGGEFLLPLADAMESLREMVCKIS